MIYLTAIEERNKHCKKIQTNHLIALCEIGEDFKSFRNDLEQLIKSRDSRNLVSKVYSAMQGNLFMISNKYKGFIEKHKHTIEIMDKYSCLGDLTVLSYDAKGKRRENLAEDYFYQYIQEHNEDVKTIKAVALKIKALGFNEINFGEKLDFTEFEYELNTLYGSDFVFLENMEVNPTYLNSPIKYRTNGSHYCLILGSSGYVSNKEVSKYDRNIVLNSLIFDPNKLPNEITTKSTIGVIQKLAEKKNEECKNIRDSIDLSISTSDLINCFENLKKVFRRIDKIKDNQELINLLNQMQNTLEQLQLFGVGFENQIIASCTSITEEIMKREKKLYLSRRLNDIDID